MSLSGDSFWSLMINVPRAVVWSQGPDSHQVPPKSFDFIFMFFFLHQKTKKMKDGINFSHGCNKASWI